MLILQDCLSPSDKPKMVFKVIKSSVAKNTFPMEEAASRSLYNKRLEEICRFFSIISGRCALRAKGQTKLCFLSRSTVAQIDLEFRMFSRSPWAPWKHPFPPQAPEYLGQSIEGRHGTSLGSVFVF